MRRVTIDQMDFMRAFARDMDFENAVPQCAYLEVATGRINWVCESDADARSELGISKEDNRAMRLKAKSSPADYVEIPAYYHNVHHKILQEFLDSDWTDNEQNRRLVKAAYHGSIGGWKREVDDQGVVAIYYQFREAWFLKKATEFLKEKGIEPQWR